MECRSSLNSDSVPVCSMICLRVSTVQKLCAQWCVLSENEPRNVIGIITKIRRREHKVSKSGERTRYGSRRRLLQITADMTKLFISWIAASVDELWWHSRHNTGASELRLKQTAIIVQQLSIFALRLRSVTDGETLSFDVTTSWLTAMMHKLPLKSISKYENKL